jgi:hypothetical protein
VVDCADDDSDVVVVDAAVDDIETAVIGGGVAAADMVSMENDSEGVIF